MISAPEATEPTMVTSPSGWTICWPDRTGASISSELTGAGADNGIVGAASVFGLPVCPRVKDGTRPSTQDGSAPSTPRMRISRLLSSSNRLRKPSFVGERSETSITTDFPAKNRGERASSASISPNQALMGVSGLTTRAWKDPPRNLKDVVGRAVVISLTLDPDRTVFVVNDRLISRTGDGKSRVRRIAAAVCDGVQKLTLGSLQLRWRRSQKLRPRRDRPLTLFRFGGCAPT